MDGKVHELSDLDIKEVSLVGSPANKRKYLLLKSNRGGKELDDVEKTLSESDQGMLKGMMKLLYKMLGKKMPEDMMPSEDKEEMMDSKKTEKEEAKKSDAEANLEQERNALKSQIEKSELEKSALAKRITELEKAEKKRALAEIAKSIEGAYEESLAYLEAMAESLPTEKFDMLIKREKALAEKIKNSDLFTESGSARPSPSGALAKVEELAKGIVAKSDNKMSYPHAVEQVLKEHPELYEEYDKETKKSMKD